MNSPVQSGLQLPGGGCIPRLGIGSWRMGENRRTRKDEIAAIRTALQLGYRLIDTAEMYGEGGAEEIIGEALRGAFAAGEARREDVFVVSKIHPHNGHRRGIAPACRRSLDRLGLDRLDLYLLHWRGSVPLAETADGFESLRARGEIAHWGVSNFDTADLEALLRVPAGRACAVNQVCYSASERGVEFELLPWMRRHDMPLMAYCPIDEGRLARHPVLAAVGRRHGATAAQVALAWILDRPGVVAIPKALQPGHIRENLAAGVLRLTGEDLAEIGRALPAPTGRQPLRIV